MKRFFKALTLLLCLVMLLSMLPVAFAEEIPAFTEHDLDKYLREISSGETFEYRTSGWAGGKRDVDHKAKAGVTARWAVFYAKDTDKSERDLMDVYAPEGVKLRYVSFNKTEMKATRKIEKLAGEGYEWRGIEVKVKYTSHPYGYSTVPCFEDYYDIIGHDETREILDEVDKDKYYLSVSQYGDENEPIYELYRSKGDGKGSVRYDVFWYVPKGYDGCVFGLLDGRKCPEWKDGTYVFDYVSKYCLLFRLQ